MASIPKPAEGMIDRIYSAIEKEEKRSLRLSRIGASSIGHACLREIWYSWRAYDTAKFGGRMLRLFRTGHLQETRVLEDLELAGFKIWPVDTYGEQFTYIDPTGHFVCKLDGVIKGVPGAEKTPHDVEIKTHSRKSYEELKKKGVEKAKPVHFYQMQAGMMFSKLPRALYIAVCKDDEDYHIERIYPDEAVQTDITERIEKLITATIIPTGVSPDGKAFECKWCDMREVCVEGKKPIKTCRSCEYVEVIPTNGEWRCSKHDKSLSQTEQLAACLDYEVKR